MFRRLFWCSLACIMTLPFAVSAQEQITFDGCIDPAGGAVRAVLDPSLVTSFETRMEGGRPVIRYNPDALPRMQTPTRLFFFAHECARINLGYAPVAARMLVDARRADCWGLVTLLRSGLIDERSVATIQSDLSFSVDEWSLLPGPPRGFDLPACVQAHAARPSLLHPTPGQDDWNTCARSCGDALLVCQKRVCAGPACEPCVRTYDQCVAACDSRFSR